METALAQGYNMIDDHPDTSDVNEEEENDSKSSLAPLDDSLIIANLFSILW